MNSSSNFKFCQGLFVNRHGWTVYDTPQNFYKVYNQKLWESPARHGRVF